MDIRGLTLLPTQGSQSPEGFGRKRLPWGTVSLGSAPTLLPEGSRSSLYCAGCLSAASCSQCLNSSGGGGGEGPDLGCLPSCEARGLYTRGTKKPSRGGEPSWRNGLCSHSPKEDSAIFIPGHFYLLLEPAGRGGHVPEQYVWPERTAAAGSMSVGPQLQLAVLWPWLLMATLQIRLGYSGLALVAAERASAQKAVIRVIPLKMDPLTLEGVFASVAEVTPAEGKLLQVRGPLSDPLSALACCLPCSCLL